MNVRMSIADAEIQRITVTLPFRPGAGDGSYVCRHLEVNRLSGPQRIALRGVFDGLVLLRERLSCGKPVVSNADCGRWLFEQIAAAVDGGNGAQSKPDGDEPKSN